MYLRYVLAAIGMVVAVNASPAGAQTALDRVQSDARGADHAEPAEQAASPAPQLEIEEAANPTTGREILVGAITFSGLEALQPADFAAIITPRLGQSLGTEGLRELTSAIAQYTRSRGFAFATARVDPQRMANGVLTVQVDEGRIDAIRFDGPDQAEVRAALSPLIDGAPARLDEVERRLLIAGDIDGVTIRNARYIREDERGILLVTLTKDHIVAQTVLTNSGTRTVGPVQLRIEVDINGLLADDDSITLSYAGTPTQPRELHFGLVRYAKRINSGGTELALTGSASEARPGAYLEDFDLRSASWSVGVNILQPLWRRRNASLWFDGELGVRNLVQWRADARVREDRIVAARGTLYGYSDFAGGRLRSSVTLSQGLDILGATRAGDPMASRFDADGTFTSLFAVASWIRRLDGPVSLRLALQSQLSSQPMLVSEEISLGGTGFLRGYDWSERSGDDGVMGLAELRYDWKKPTDFVSNAQFYGFVDGGKVTNGDSDFGSGSLASAGGGLRADIGASLGASVELAVPLSGPRYDTGDNSPKVNLRVAKSF